MKVERDDRNGSVEVWTDDAAYEAWWNWDDDEGKGPAKPAPALRLNREEQAALVFEVLRGPVGHPGPTGPMGASGRSAENSA